LTYSPLPSPMSVCIAIIFRYKLMELMEIVENFRFTAKQIDPSKFTKIINKNDVIFLATKRINGRTLHIRENKI
jgi:hypothetical protein